MTRARYMSAFAVAALLVLACDTEAKGATGWAVGVQAGWQASGQLTLAETGASSAAWIVLDNGPCWGACFSPDASEVAYVENGAIKVISIYGTNPRVVKPSGLFSSGTRANTLSWCDDGYVYYSLDWSIYRVKADGSGGDALVHTSKYASGWGGDYIRQLQVCRDGTRAASWGRPWISQTDTNNDGHVIIYTIGQPASDWKQWDHCMGGISKDGTLFDACNASHLDADIRSFASPDTTIRLVNSGGATMNGLRFSQCDQDYICWIEGSTGRVTNHVTDTIVASWNGLLPQDYYHGDLFAASPTYALTVNNGGGGGTYTAGAVVSIVADAPLAGQIFDQWTGDTAAVADVNASTTTVTMPAAAVGVTATYVVNPGGPTVITVPADGGDLVEGQTYTLTGTGDGTLTWSYDANSDGLGRISIGTGASVEFTIPAGINPPKQIYIFLDATGGEVSVLCDVLDAGAASLQLDAPNGGESFLAGDPTYICWTSTGVTAVTIEYSSDGGASWWTIDADVDISELEWANYYWVVPGVSSSECLVRVSDNASAVADASDASFAIVAPFVTLLSPQGGDIWYVGTTRHIEWDAGGIDNVMILYSTAGGTSGSWELVESSYDINDVHWGAFPWTVPNAPSTDCLVHIADYNGVLDADQSGVFTIATIIDNDGDGMDDGWETTTFGDTSHDGAADGDGDGLTDFEEFMEGWDPLTPDNPDPAGETDGGGPLSCAVGDAGATGSMLALVIAVLSCAMLRRRPCSLRSPIDPAGRRPSYPNTCVQNFPANPNPIRLKPALNMFVKWPGL